MPRELAAKGFEVDRRKIQLDEPLKSLGEFTVAIKLHREVTAHVKVKVLAEATDEAAAEPAAEACSGVVPTQPRTTASRFAERQSSFLLCYLAMKFLTHSGSAWATREATRAPNDAPEFAQLCCIRSISCSTAVASRAPKSITSA